MLSVASEIFALFSAATAFTSSAAVLSFALALSIALEALNACSDALLAFVDALDACPAPSLAVSAFWEEALAANKALRSSAT